MPQSRPSRPRPSRQPRGRAHLPSAISQADSTRYYAFRGGVSKEELAARENVKLSTIEASIQKFEVHKAQHSAEATETNVRRGFNESLPEMWDSINQGLKAMKSVQVGAYIDPETGETRFDYEQVPDFDTQFTSIEKAVKLLKEAMPKTPMVAVDARSQHLHQVGGQPGQLGQGAPTSAEAIIRQIRAERGLALTAGEEPIVPQPVAPIPHEVDYELAAELAEAGEPVEAESAEPEPEYVDEDDPPTK